MVSHVRTPASRHLHYSSGIASLLEAKNGSCRGHRAHRCELGILLEQSLGVRLEEVGARYGCLSPTHRPGNSITELLKEANLFTSSQGRKHLCFMQSSRDLAHNWTSGWTSSLNISLQRHLPVVGRHMEESVSHSDIWFSFLC